jgi:hypothetical protein
MKKEKSFKLEMKRRYKIQVFSGDRVKQKKTLNDCKQNFTDLDSTIVTLKL